MSALSGLSGNSGINPRKIYRFFEEFSYTESNGELWKYGTRLNPLDPLTLFALFSPVTANGILFWSKDPFPSDFSLVSPTLFHPGDLPSESCIDFICPMGGVYNLRCFISLGISVDGVKVSFRKNGVNLNSLILLPNTSDSLDAEIHCIPTDILTLSIAAGEAGASNALDATVMSGYRIIVY